MSGINGLVSFNRSNETLNRELIYLMNNKINYRGPNGNFVYADDYCGFGMVSLSILDNNDRNKEIYNLKHNKVIVFDGHIYNHLEIKKELVSRGYVFNSETVTEVVLTSFEEFGSKCLDLFNGMFAFSIYDLKRNEIFIGRDRVGKKPLYYYKDNSNFIFSSELKSIISTNYIDKKINFDSLANYFRFYYIPEPNTIFKNVYKLPAAHFMRVKVKSKEIYMEKYWDISKADYIEELSIAKTELRSTLTKAVERRMENNMPIGAFLSGGIDSSIMVGLMTEVSSRPIHTFTLGYKDNKLYDESNLARKVAAHNSTIHHEEFINHKDIQEVIEKLLKQIDEPFADSSMIPSYFIAKAIKSTSSVAIAGDGGDELFAGYNKYTSIDYAKKLNKFPSFINNKFLPLILNIMPQNSNNIIGSYGTKINKFLKSYSSEPDVMHCKLMEVLSEENLNDLLLKDFSLKEVNMQIKDYFYTNELTSDVERMQYTDLKFALPSDMLVKVDRTSMKNSLEVRSPFLDKEVIELAYRIPLKYKMKNSSRKIILKDTFNDLLPVEILNAPKKGFGVPIGEWFKNELKSMLLEVLSPSNVKKTGILNYGFIEKILKEHFDEKKNHSNLLWSLFVFHYWYKNTFE